MEKLTKKLLILVGPLMLMTGCQEHSDQRLTQMALQQTKIQAEQSRQMLELQQEVATGARQLVSADAQSRQEIVAMQHDLQIERANMAQRWDQLEQERKSLASQRYFDSVIAEVISNLGIILICLLPLVVCWQLLRQTIEPAMENEVAELLLEDLVSSKPLLFPQKPFMPENSEYQELASDAPAQNRLGTMNS